MVCALTHAKPLSLSHKESVLTAWRTLFASLCGIRNNDYRSAFYIGQLPASSMESVLTKRCRTLHYTEIHLGESKS